ncbi:D-alanyl-D-alanine carboxypeptidase family protein [Chlorobium phaeovibrioides]|nr:D-alanyl-D-alanine carboxypeptidase [Chlorobium phaeovibrioides]
MMKGFAAENEFHIGEGMMHNGSGRVKRMFSMTAVSVILLFSLFFRAGTAEAAVPVLIDSYIIKDLGYSRVFMSKDSDRLIRPASLTKILTCVLAIESGKLDQIVVIPREATLVEPTKAGFRTGDRIRLIDLVKASMVSSSNDAAFAIAMHLSGSVKGFVAAMNYRARAIGMKHSSFTNPAGFDTGEYSGNLSTAEDLLVLTEYAIRLPHFNDMAMLGSVIVPEYRTGKMFLLRTHNKLLARYPYAVGIKTGFTRRAGKCLIARAQKNGRDMLLVMLNARGDRWGIAEEMFEKAFSTLESAFRRFAEAGEGGLRRPDHSAWGGKSKLQ